MAITHALMAWGDVAMVVALANSFLSVDADAARGKVLLYLAVSFAPFAVVAPLIGPFVDRARGGRRFIIQLTSIGRAIAYILLIGSIDSILMFPLAFACMVLQKTYGVSKSALVPSVVSNDEELVEANSKLGLFAGVVAGVGAIPLGILSLISPKVALVAGALIFAAATLSARRLPRDVVAAQPARRDEQQELRQPRLVMAASALGLIRASIGFLFFHLFFWIRTEHYPTYWLGLAVASVTVGVMIGNAVAPILRRKISEEVMLTGSLAMVGIAGLLAAIAGGVGAAVLLSTTVNIAAAIGRMAFESIVQNSAPDANRGRAFAQFETRFQLSWVIGGVIASIFLFPGWVGFLIVGVIGAFATLTYLVGVRAVRAGRPIPESMAARARREIATAAARRRQMRRADRSATGRSPGRGAPGRPARENTQSPNALRPPTPGTRRDV